jgi:hypothetical protein
MKNVACQVCGNYTISDHGSYEICSVCFWEDDGLYDNPDEVWYGPNDILSLTQARKNYQAIGAVSQEKLKLVRKPFSYELPQYNTSTYAPNLNERLQDLVDGLKLVEAGNMTLAEIEDDITTYILLDDLLDQLDKQPTRRIIDIVEAVDMWNINKFTKTQLSDMRVELQEYLQSS